jgi:hypothetical protein
MKFKTPYEQGKCDCHYRRYDRDRACWNEQERIEYDKGWEYGQKTNYFFDDNEHYNEENYERKIKHHSNAVKKMLFLT